MATPAETPPTDPGAALLQKYAVAEDPDSTPTEQPESTAGAPDTSGSASPTAAAPVGTPPSTPASVANDAPRHPESLVRRARKLGFDDDDLADLDTDSLRDAVSERLASTAAERAATAVLNAAGRPYDPATGRLLPANQPAQAAEQPKGDEFALGMTPDDLENAGVTRDLHPVLQKLLAPLVAEIKALKADRDQLVAEAKHRRAGETVTRFDKQFSKHADVYGDKPFEELDPESGEYSRRQAVYAEMGRVVAAGQQTTFEKDFAKAHARLFGSFRAAAPAPAPEAKPAEANGVHNRIGDKFKHGHALVPTDRQPKAQPKGPRRAEEAVARKLEEARLTDDDHDEADDLPE